MHGLAEVMEEHDHAVAGSCRRTWFPLSAVGELERIALKLLELACRQAFEQTEEQELGVDGDRSRLERQGADGGLISAELQVDPKKDLAEPLFPSLGRGDGKCRGTCLRDVLRLNRATNW